MTQATAPVVRHAADRQRYEIEVDGRTAGHTDYRDRGNQRVFFHTEVGEEFAGQGLASQLVGEALNDVRTSGRRVVPVCPHVNKYLSRHDGFADITDPVTPEGLQWLDGVLG
ncbi:GNAT family N-acetyltransferase [Streptomyces sp. NPDC003781]|uniref:GNAT family N-acetyltransferase n=1 Tax=Streptomyces sp. NPDC003781 TaxID=3364686 RepID=UPI0036C5B2EA